MKKIKNKKIALTNNKRIDTLYKNIAEYIHSARNNILQTVNVEQVKAYWLIGRDIVEEEQAGKDRAEYGAFLLEEISVRLIKEFGSGFGIRTLIDIRKFYLTYQLDLLNSKKGKTHALRAKSQIPKFNSNLSWTHYRILMSEPRKEIRKFYEIETLKNNWSTRELERQMGSLLFERLAKSKDKKGLMKLAYKGQAIIKPEDAIKEPLILEFLNIPESHKLVESKLEEALINNMQKFLLEMGRGFAFVARQKRLTLDGKHFYCDLVFYHYVLKRFILMDLKTHELNHADLGQMQLYVNYFDMEEKAKDDNPTIGLILCTEQSKKMVKYFFGDKNSNIFANKYQFCLPTEKELEQKLKKEIKEIKHKLTYKNKNLD
jgi:predicted nuclease of restriction endonuclease-like (RecB) superfamily